jgi:hypothetical protein
VPSIRPAYLLLLAVTAQAQISLTVSPNPSTLGQAVTLTATLSPGSGGTVTFYDGVNVLGIARAVGSQAAYSTTLLAAGPHSLRARYNGDSSHPPVSTAGISATVTARASYAVQAPNNYSLPPGATHAYDASYTLGSCLAVADFNKDGKADVATGIGGGVTIMLGAGGGTFRTPVFYDLGASTAYNCMAVEDYNGDGAPDIAVAVATGAQVTAIAINLSFSSPRARLTVAQSRTGDLAAGNLSYTITLSNSAGSDPLRVQ